MIDLNIKQAEVPDGCTIIKNENGTAPCMWFEHNGKIIVAMPGVPFEMKYLMTEEIIPRLKSTLNLDNIYHKTILTAGLGESFLAQEINDIEEALPQHISLAYLPKLGQVRLRLSASGSDLNKVKAEVDTFSASIISRIAKYVVTEQDIPLEQAILNDMRTRGLTLSTAESCTGGFISHLLTQHAGASAVFLGGAVVYTNALKQSILGVQESTLTRFGAVSEETVKEMALGANKHLKSDYSIAVSGIAGPDGGSEEKPVGTVWIAIAHHDAVVAKCFNFGNKRLQNIERAAIAGLTYLLHVMKQDIANS